METILAILSPFLLLIGGFLLWYPTVKPEVGAGGWGGRRHDWSAKKSTPENIVRDDKYSWSDRRFYTTAWILIVVGTFLGIASFLLAA